MSTDAPLSLTEAVGRWDRYRAMLTLEFPPPIIAEREAWTLTSAVIVPPVILAKAFVLARRCAVSGRLRCRLIHGGALNQTIAHLDSHEARG